MEQIRACIAQNLFLIVKLSQVRWKNVFVYSYRETRRKRRGLLLGYSCPPPSPPSSPSPNLGVNTMALPPEATPKAEINTFMTVTKKMPTIVKLLILFATQISFLFFTLYRVLSNRPTPTATCKRFAALDRANVKVPPKEMHTNDWVEVREKIARG